MARIARSVTIYPAPGQRVTYHPGDEPPPDHAAHIRNPDAWEGGVLPADLPDLPVRPTPGAGLTIEQITAQLSGTFATPEVVDVRDVTRGLGPIYARALFRDTQVVPVVFFGSSSTAGANIPEPDRWVSMLAAQHTETPVPYPSYAAANQAVQNAPPGLLFINLGINGANTSNYVDPARITQIGSWNPALVVHMIGTNDTILPGTSAAQAAANIAANIDAIDAASALPIGHLYVHQHERFDQAKTYPWSAHLAAVRAMAATRPNVSVLDLNRRFLSVNISSGDPLGLMLDDDVHVNALGHLFYARLMEDALNLPRLALTPVPDPDPEPDPDPDPEPGAMVLSDDFNRPDSLLAGSAATTGQTWEVPAGIINVTDGRMVPATGSGVTALINAGTSDVDILVDVNYAGTGLVGVVFRALDVNTNRWGAFLDGTAVKLYRHMSSTTTIAKQTTWAGTAGSHTMRVRAKGASVEVWVDDISVLTFEMAAGDATTSAAWTKVGARTSAAAATWDNLVVRQTL